MNGFASKLTNGKLPNGTDDVDDEVEVEMEQDDEDSEEEETSVDLNYQDPGANLKVVKAENGNDNDSAEYRKRVHQLASALLQIGQGVDPKYFKPPFGSLKAGKNGKEAAQVKAKHNFDQWCVSLMSSINISQLFLHYNVLYDAIKWTRSAQNARCVCRSNRDPDKLILCDGCNLGRHIYCLKPKLTVSLAAAISNFFSGLPFTHFFIPETIPPFMDAVHSLLYKFILFIVVDWRINHIHARMW